MKLEKLRYILSKRSEERFTFPYSDDAVNYVVELSSNDDIRAYVAIINHADALLDAVEALKFYADPNHWTIDWVEGSHGDYGDRARKALAKLEAVE